MLFALPPELEQSTISVGTYLPGTAPDAGHGAEIHVSRLDLRMPAVQP